MLHSCLGCRILQQASSWHHATHTACAKPPPLAAVHDQLQRRIREIEEEEAPGLLRRTGIRRAINLSSHVDVRRAGQERRGGYCRMRAPLATADAPLGMPPVCCLPLLLAGALAAVHAAAAGPAARHPDQGRAAQHAGEAAQPAQPARHQPTLALPAHFLATAVATSARLKECHASPECCAA